MVLEKVKARWLQILVHLGALLPLVLLGLGYTQGWLGFDPIRELELRTGRYGLILLILSLACTPIKVVLGFGRVMRVRRALGLYAFLYTCLHLLVFVGLDYGFDFGLIWPALLEKRFALVGLATFLLLLPLAVTSTRGWMRRLGKNWRRLHRLAYLAAILDVVHFVWVVKQGNPRPLPFAVVLALLLIVRIPPIRNAINKTTKSTKDTKSL
jgi:sulfoxide reductase heme-binding subunit YedZ